MSLLCDSVPLLPKNACGLVWFGLVRGASAALLRVPAVRPPVGLVNGRVNSMQTWGNGASETLHFR